MHHERRQGKIWLITLPHREWSPNDGLPDDCCYIKGQLEQGEETGYVHWQALVYLKKKGSIRTLQGIFGERGHYELSRSTAAESYVWKESTRIGEPFELGQKPTQRNSKEHWEAIWTAAMWGDLLAIPADIRIQHYRTLRAIASDFAQPTAMERSAVVYWGKTGVGTFLLTQARVNELGKKEEWKLSVKIPAPSGGTVLFY